MNLDEAARENLNRMIESIKNHLNLVNASLDPSGRLQFGRL